MSTTIMSIHWWTLDSDERRMMTLFSSPTAGTCGFSSWMILVSVFSRWMFKFLQTDRGMTFVDVPESTRQLWMLKLKISNDKRKGGVDPLEFAFMVFTIDLTLGLACTEALLTGLLVEVLAKALRICSR